MKESETGLAELKTAFDFYYEVEVQKDVNGIEMGVLENGIPYLTSTGLGRICGTTHSRISEITREWEEHFNDEIITKGRISFIRDYLFSEGYREPRLYISSRQGARDINAYPEVVCMAILEFYALESTVKNTIALDHYRKLARHGLREFIYAAVGYSVENVWKYHLDRVSILKNKTPHGYFTVFQEIAGMIVDLIEAGLTVNEKTIPDISVGLSWSKFWENSGLGDQKGARKKYEHEYPEYYPQSASNPQPAWAYPDDCLPDFRRWFKEVYLPSKFPIYILKKANLLKGGPDEAVKMIEIFNNKGLPDKS